MTRWIALVAAAAAAVFATLAGFGSGQARAIDQVNECPSAIGEVVDPWVLASAGDGSVRLADRDGDGSVCVARVVVRDRVLLTLVTDNAIGNPNIIPPGPCTNPFLAVAIGNPGLFPERAASTRTPTASSAAAEPRRARADHHPGRQPEHDRAPQGGFARGRKPGRGRRAAQQGQVAHRRQARHPPARQGARPARRGENVCST